MIENSISKDRYSEIFEWCYGRDLNAIWSYMEDEFNDFSLVRNGFLNFLGRLLQGKKIKLIKNDKQLSGTPEELVDIFRKSIPLSVQDADDRCTKLGFKKPYDGFGMNVWWFLDECPAGIVWLPCEKNKV